MSKYKEIDAGEGNFSAYWTDPQGRKPDAGMVVIQEIFGLTPFIAGVVDDFASGGFSAAAPDLFWHQEPAVVLNPDDEADRARAMQLNAGLDEGKAIDDCAATVEALRRSLAGARKVGCIGYCLGGRLAYLLAARTDIDAAVGYYGVAIDQRLDEAVNIRRPLLLHIAGDDHICLPDAQRTIVEALRERAPSAVVHVYEGAKHGFARVGSPNYNAAAAELADRRTRAFFEEHLAR